MRCRNLLALGLACGVLPGGLVRAADSSATVTEKSYQRAREILEAGKKALGVKENSPGVDTVSYKVSGKFYARNQSPSPEKAEALPFEGSLTVDLTRGWVAWEARAVFPGGFPFANRVLLKGDQGENLNLLLKTSTPALNAALTRDILGFRVPQYLLNLATQRAVTLRSLGEAAVQGKPHNVISFATAAGVQVALYFDVQSHLLTRYETMFNDPVAGDGANQSTFTGYGNFGGVLLPTGVIQTLDGEMFQDFQLSAHSVNAQLPADLFEAPKDFTAVATPPTVPLAVKELAKDVYMVEGLGGGTHCAMFVAFDDYVLVLEGPTSDAATQSVLQKIKETAPGKPIKYVVALHHHADHVGGIRTYFAEGVPLLTTPGNVAYFQRLAAAKFTLPVDSLQKNPRKPVIETVQGKKRVFTDGTHTVELVDIGPNPHANEMLVAWLPNEKILFEGDLMNRNPDNSITPAFQATLHFAEFVRKMGWPVEKLVDVHSRVNTLQDLWTSVELGKKQNPAERTGGSR